MKSTFAIGILVVGASCVFAQNPGDPERLPVPSGPLLAKAPEAASWRIATAGLLSKGFKAPGDIKWAVVIKNGRNFHSDIVLENGMELEEWWVGGVQVLRKKGESVLVVSRQKGEPFYMSYEESDFPDVSWLAADCYSGTQRINGRLCLVFKKDESAAWIDAETRLPVQFLENGVIKSYTFLPRPDASIVIPPEVSKEIAAVQELKARASRHAPRP